MSATSEDDRRQWLECIQDAIRDNPFHKVIADKKAAIRRRSGGGNKPGPAPAPAVEIAETSSLSSSKDDGD